MSSETSSYLQKKTKILYTSFFVFAIVLIAAAFRWQIVNAEKFQQIAAGRVFTSELRSLRGTIYSKDGTTLAYSEPRFDMYLWMGDVRFFEELGLQTRKELISKVSDVIDLTSEELENLIEHYQNDFDHRVDWFRIAESLTADQWRELTNIKTDSNEKRLLKGFSFDYTSQRIYPEGRLASHILGLTNKFEDKIEGEGGIEGAMDGDLNPRSGYVVKENDAIGQAISRSLVLSVEPKPGSSIYLTIDKKLQMIVEKTTKENVERFKASSGTTIIMDPKTGDILAMANYPDYNPNLREETNQAVYTNHAITIPYEIGSVGKIFTLSASLDLGIIDTSTIILPNGHEGCEKISDDLRPICTWDKQPQPPMEAWECFKYSDNLCFYHIALLLNDDDFYTYLKSYGLGTATGIDLSGEDQGTLKGTDEWTLGDVAAFSYGHGYTATPLQVIDAVSVLPNMGVRMKPKIIDKIIKGDGEIIEYAPEAFNEEKLIIKEETAKTMNEILYATYLHNIKDYETWYQDLKNYKIGMKSGTALIYDNGTYGPDVNSTQIGYDLSDDRKFIMLVKLEKPENGLTSFYNSRVMWLETFKEIKDYLQIPRTDQ